MNFGVTWDGGLLGLGFAPSLVRHHSDEDQPAPVDRVVHRNTNSNVTDLQGSKGTERVRSIHGA